MKVSVITATYNLIANGRETTFRQMVASLRKQTYKNIEHLVVDGASTDGTIEILKEMAKSGLIKYISEPDSGIYDAMNKGAAMASGDVITFLNSDDFFHNPNGVENAVKAFDRGVDYSYARVRVINGTEICKNAGRIKWLRLLRNMPFPHPGMMVKKSVFEKLGGFDTSFRLVGDYDFILRLLLGGYKGKKVSCFASFRSGGATDVYANKHKEEISRVYKKNYTDLIKTLNVDWQKVANNYIFPSELIKNIIIGNYPVAIKISALYIGFNSFNRRLRERLKKL